jgi:cytoskeletal protein CcmA (bactofilin family)
MIKEVVAGKTAQSLHVEKMVRAEHIVVNGFTTVFGLLDF